MSSINRVTLIGRLGHDLKSKTTGQGLTVVDFSLATNEVWNNKATGQKEEKTDWHHIVAQGKKAELCLAHLKKGDLIYVEGRLDQHQYDDKITGDRRTHTKILASTIRFLTSKGKEYDPTNDSQTVSCE